MTKPVKLFLTTCCAAAAALFVYSKHLPIQSF